MVFIELYFPTDDIPYLIERFQEELNGKRRKQKRKAASIPPSPTYVLEIFTSISRKQP